MPDLCGQEADVKIEPLSIIGDVFAILRSGFALEREYMYYMVHGVGILRAM